MATQNNIQIKNKKAYFEYNILEKYTAGLVLQGTEIKSIRAGKASIAEAYCIIVAGEAFIRNMNISEYSFGSYNNHDPKRDRKLLLNRRELKKLHNKIRETGLTIVPLLLFLSPEGFAKIEIALAKGKKMYDKRESLKENDNRREMERKDTYKE
ncbi:MAG: SsrA-binding protein [Bacteroidetes bacterium GWF2_43_63]|nr:MAG: SsrA-binding protein [Bacteroidetes bacterium GWE2_42_42]OFY56393.1 MAG: SsrA-binding protein [Bacteroidetes bacterium GWF2_43_63]HBG69638.1 SsrA-binding protein [Bacteroidales bacterium]HCB61904.1 SsrA-binding protein [Bacteroidales bacterium]HCY22130.1 SsrA-binding protein [Bacteroidales bacterium]